MYLQHYGFRDKPFKLTHDPAYYYGEAHQIPLNELCYSIEERHGLAILLGEPGTGKTTLLLRLLRSFSRHLNGVFLSDVAVGEASLIRQVGRALLLPFKPQDSTETVAQYLDIFLRGQVTAGKTVVVLIDEAQGLTDGQLEELRHLTNLEHKGRKLLELVLAGLPSLERKFRMPDLESLSQRAVVRCWVEPMSLEHTRSYIRHRLDVVGAPNPDMFSSDGVERLHQATSGIPRLVNIVCERSLLIGYVEETQVLRATHVDQAVADLNLKPISDSSMDQATGAFGFEGNLLLRMSAQLDTIMRKLEALESSAGSASGGPTEEPRLRQWLKSLRSNPLKEPTGGPFDELVENPLRSRLSQAKPETNH
jgi:general secretion pathway protein A